MSTHPFLIEEEGNEALLRTNPFQEEGNDGDKANVWSGDNLEQPSQVPMGPITRSRAKKLKAMLNGLIQAIWAQEQGTIKPVQGEKRGAQNEGWTTLIQAQIN